MCCRIQITKTVEYRIIDCPYLFVELKTNFQKENFVKILRNPKSGGRGYLLRIKKGHGDVGVVIRAVCIVRLHRDRYVEARGDKRTTLNFTLSLCSNEAKCLSAWVSCICNCARVFQGSSVDCSARHTIQKVQNTHSRVCAVRGASCIRCCTVDLQLGRLTG